MDKQLYWVVVRTRKRPGSRLRRKMTIVKRFGPMEYEKAEKRRNNILADLDHELFRVEVNADRAAYFIAYHQKRYATDPEYRERHRKRARDWNRKSRAAARGDMTPWLTQD